MKLQTYVFLKITNLDCFMGKENVETSYYRILVLTVFISTDKTVEHLSVEYVKLIVTDLGNWSLKHLNLNKIAEILSDIIFAVSCYPCVK